MTKRRIASGGKGGAAVVAMLACASSLLAHHSLAQFDTTNAVRVKGAIVRIELVNPHTILFLEQKDASGQTDRWALEGPGIMQLTRTGFDKATFKIGDIIEACGYVSRGAAEYKRTIGSDPIRISGRLMDAEMLVMPDGQKRTWSDYGFHKCLGPDYVDHHKSDGK